MILIFANERVARALFLLDDVRLLPREHDSLRSNTSVFLSSAVSPLHSVGSLTDLLTSYHAPQKRGVGRSD